jgi:hypothetical protein
MPDDTRSRIRTLWLRAWPAWTVLGAIAVIIAGMILGEAVPVLQENRFSALAGVGGTGCLIVFGLPLLAAWAVWSLLRVRHWAARVAIYLVLWCGDAWLAGWLFVNFMGWQS